MNERIIAPDFQHLSLGQLSRLDGRVAVVTGAARGIGKRIAERLAEAGAAVCIADIDEEGAAATAESIAEEFGVPTNYHATDVSSRDSIEGLVSRANELGAIRIWVNNAGIYPANSLLDVSEPEWNRVLEINLSGVLFATQAAAQAMLEHDDPNGNVIINVGSVSGMRGRQNLVAYGAAKHGVHGITRSLGLELAPQGIRVVAVAPSMVETPGMQARRDQASGAQRSRLIEVEQRLIDANPSGRQANPDDIARATWFLASDAAAYITGAVIPVDGGVSAS